MKKTQKSKRRVNKLNVAAIIVSVICLIEVLGILASSLFLLNNLKDKPELSIDDFQNQESSIVYDVHGDVIAELGMTIRENVGYNELPTSLIDAFVAVEDSRFFSHNGFDVPRFTAALLNNIRTMSFSQGGSTFTMQLVKNTYCTLMTRGMKGCYAFCCDKALGEYLKSRITSWLAISDDQGNLSFKQL